REGAGPWRPPADPLARTLRFRGGSTLPWATRRGALRALPPSLGGRAGRGPAGAPPRARGTPPLPQVRHGLALARPSTLTRRRDPRQLRARLARGSTLGDQDLSAHRWHRPARGEPSACRRAARRGRSPSARAGAESEP